MNEKILVLDDEPLILKTIERALGKKGYQVRVTGDPEGFLRELAGGHVPLLIMDLNLGSADINDLVRRAREMSPQSRILFISGSLPEDPGRHFLEKPFRIEDLRKKVREMLDSAHSP